MGRRPHPINLMLVKGKKHLTKKEIEERKEAEEKLRPKKQKVKCPSWLRETAKKEWKRIAPELMELGILTHLDQSVFAMYCDAFSRYQEITQYIDQHGYITEYTNKSRATNLQTNPYVKISNQYLQLARNCALEFGLTPTSRVRMVLPKEDKPEDPFGEMFD